MGLIEPQEFKFDSSWASSWGPRGVRSVMTS